ncbi:MAG: S8 family serine peptidase, partial [Clostridiales bacterium]|nr:S8 family serine peptidase [Clostridiales bacterium]
MKFSGKEKIHDMKIYLQSKKGIKFFSPIKNNIGIIIASGGSALTLDKLKTYADIENAMPAYEFGSFPFYLTGEILLQPKPGVPIEKILEFIHNKAKIESESKYNTFVLETDHWDKLLEYSNQIYESGLVIYCHPNFIAPIEKTIDPLYSAQYYLNNTGQFGGTSGIDINAPEAWNITKGSSTIKVAVIDDGVEIHEELTGRILQGFTPQTSSNNPDTHGTPNANDPRHTDFPYDSDEPFGHGECCAGIIAASHNNVGIRGIAPNIEIVPINIFNDWSIIKCPDYRWDSMLVYNEDARDIARAIDWAWDNGNADVLSDSWGYSTTDPDKIPHADNIIAAIGRARIQGRNKLGSVVVFASGNANLSFSGVTFPANVAGVITVGAIDKKGNIWNFSSCGLEMNLVAPTGNTGLNGDVRTIDRMGSNGYENGNYTTRFGGTSAACPQISGVVALMLSSNPFLTETQVRTTLQQTATDMGATGFDNTFGFGRVNAYTAVNSVHLYISGSVFVCTSNSTFILHNRPTGTTVTWTKSSNLTYVSGQGTNNYRVRASSSSTSGSGWVQANISPEEAGSHQLSYRLVGSNSVPFKKTFWIGKP